MENYRDIIISSTKKKYKKPMKREVDNFLKNRTFKELNIKILKRETDDHSFIDDRGLLHKCISNSTITINTRDKTRIDFTKYYTDIRFFFEDKNFNYFYHNIYCIDSLNRVWSIKGESLELLQKFFIGLDDSYFTNIKLNAE